MAMPNSAPIWTVEMVHELPEDGQRYEVIDGELLVSPSPTLLHQLAAFALVRRLDAYLRGRGIGLVIFAPLDVTYSPTTNVQPDVLVLPLVNGKVPASVEEAGRLLLVAEVRSPSTARADRGVKRRLYQREGIPEYWIVDADAQSIERWRPGDARPEIITDRIEWRPEGASEPLVIELEAFFGSLSKE